jgi:hypothetical protein
VLSFQTLKKIGGKCPKDAKEAQCFYGSNKAQTVNDQWFQIMTAERELPFAHMSTHM